MSACTITSTIRAFPSAILLRRIFILLAETAYADPIADMLPDTLFNGQGRVAALAYAAGLRPAREMIPPFEDEAWLEAEFARRGVFSGRD